MRSLHGRAVLLLLLLILALSADNSRVAAARHRQQAKHGSTKSRSHKKKAPKVIQLKELMYDLSCQDHELASSLDSSSCRGVGQHRQMYCPRNRGEDFSDLDTAAANDSECKEAWVTVLADDAFLPGVLVLLHSIRQYAEVNRDFVVLVSAEVSRDVTRQLEEECVVVRRVDPRASAKGQRLQRMSARYESGYWQIKMHIWRLMEYEKVVYMDGDIFMRQNADALFCANIPKGAVFGAVPKSPKNRTAGFNAGTFVLRPSLEVFDEVQARFDALTDEEMLATCEQDFLNLVFRGRFSYLPVDSILKHRRWVAHPLAWNVSRVLGFHMNGPPKPWDPHWLTKCAYPPPHGEKVKEYTQLFTNWWRHYYDMIEQPLPSDQRRMALRPEHDPADTWQHWDERRFIASGCGFNASVGTLEEDAIVG